MKKPGVFLLSIGDELLDGRTVNTNAAFFGEELRNLGISVAEVRAVADDVKAIAKALHDANEYSVVAISGGLGPTNDDRTAEAAAATFSRELRFTKASVHHVVRRYRERNRPVTRLRLRQALLPEGTALLENPTGIAPGFLLKHNDTQFFFFPGVPRECRPMFTSFVLPAAKRHASKHCVARELWRTFGLPEATVYQKIRGLVEPLEKQFPETLRFGVHISFPSVDVSLEVWKVPGKASLSPEGAKELADKISRRLGNIVYSRRKEGLEEVVLRLLRERGETLSSAESCTGGLVGKLCTDIAGSSDIYWGGVITYANSAKKNLLEVKHATLKRHGAVSLETVKEMAENGRRLSGTDHCLALSGISGPGGGSPQKPVGTIFVALATQHKTITGHQVIGGGFLGREWNRTFAAHFALDILRQQLLV